MKNFRLLFAAIMLFALTTTVTAKPNEAHLKSLATDLFEAMNSGDTLKIERFLKAHYINADSASAIVRWQGHFRRYASGLPDVKVHSIDASDPEHLSALVHTSDPRAISPWVTITINMDADIPEKFRSISRGAGRDPNVILPDRVLTNEEIASYVSEFVDDMVARDVFSGTVSLAVDGKTFFTGAYGKADLRWGIDNKLDTKFNLGSMNKMFTGLAICQLAAKDQLSFDDPISKFLPDYPNKEAAQKVTVHHLLTHTSGMGSYWGAMAEMDWTNVRTVAEFAELSANDSLEFEPGDHFSYSNSGPQVLGLIIEAISGMDYHDYIREYVTGPAGMINTDCYENDAIVPNLAQGYYWNDETNTYFTNVFEHSVRGSAAGGGFSTVEDLQRFAKAIYDGTLLSPEMVEIYTTGKVETGPDDKYAYLISDSRWEGHRTIGHSGGAPGINADLKIFTDLGYTVTAMSNYDEAASAITRYATQLIIHKRPAPEDSM